MTNTKKLHINIEPSYPTPIYQQIRDQILFAIVSGEFRTGDVLPSVRDLAGQIQANPNTVMKAYRELELHEIVETRRGVGVRVSAQGEKRCAKRTHEIIQLQLREAISSCIAAGMDQTQILEKVKRMTESTSTTYRRAGRIA